MPVKSDSDIAPVGETVNMPNSRCVLPLLPRRFAIGVMVFVPEVEIDPVRFRLAERAAEKVGVWKVSLRRIRW